MKENGDCFVAAGRYILYSKDDNEKLVHGVVEGQDELYGILFTHAWVERGNICIDKSNGKNLELPKNVYYALGKVREKYIKKYSKIETTKNLLKFEHWGPWDETLLSWEPRKKKAGE